MIVACWTMYLTPAPCWLPCCLSSCGRYGLPSTPMLLAGTAPSSGGAGTAINITGANLADCVNVRFLPTWGVTGSSYNGSVPASSQQIAGNCSVTSAAPGWALCPSAPALTAARYWLVLERANGELSVDGSKVRGHLTHAHHLGAAAARVHGRHNHCRHVIKLRNPSACMQCGVM